MTDRHSQIDDKMADEFPELWDDDACLAGFVRLLRAANNAWPQRTYWHGHVKDTAMARLTQSGLVIADGKRFTIKGLDSRRQMRSDAGRIGAVSRWHANRNANRNAIAMPGIGIGRGRGIGSSTAADGNAERNANGNANRIDAAQAFYDASGGQASPKQLAWVDEMAKQYGDDAVASEIGRQALDGTRDLLPRVKGALALAANQSEKERAAAEKEYQRKERERIESMPAEQREANLAKLREQIKGVAG